jgi:hypothetical protein
MVVVNIWQMVIIYKFKSLKKYKINKYILYV